MEYSSSVAPIPYNASASAIEPWSFVNDIKGVQQAGGYNRGMQTMVSQLVEAHRKAIMLYFYVLFHAE